MATASIRRDVLRALITKQYGGIARQFAIAAKKPAGQINDMLATPPRKSFGEKVARQIEKELGLIDGYFDQPITTEQTKVSEPEASRYAVFSPSITEVIQLMETLTHAQQRDVAAAVKMFLLTCSKDDQNSTQRAAQ